MRFQTFLASQLIVAKKELHFYQHVEMISSTIEIIDI